MLLHYPLTLLQTLTLLILSYTTYRISRRIYWYLTIGARQRRFAASKGCQPPKKWRTLDPFFGLDFLWASYKAVKAHKALDMLQEQYAIAGSCTAELRLLGQVIISTIEPENLKSVLSLDFKSYGLSDGRKKSLIPFLGEGIFTTDGAAWQHSRDMLRPNFVRTQIGDIEMFEKHIQNVLRTIPRDGTTMIDLHGVFFSMSLDIASEFLFGESTGVLKPEGGNEAAKEFVRAFSYAQDALEGMEGKWGFLSLFLPDPRSKREIKTVHSYVDTIVETAMENQSRYEASKQKEGSRYVFLHELCSQTHDTVKIRSELLNILLAGRDTTASLLSNVWFELSKRPEVWSRLRKEVDALNGNFPSFEQMKEMKYLRGILNESLRLYPVVPANDRQAIVDTILPVGGGKDGKAPIYVKKGQSVHWSCWSMHRRKDLYGEDAEDFKPERWLDEGGKKGLRVGWEYLPFNGGARICIGQQFALTEASYITVRLMQEFIGIESRDPKPWTEKFSLTCSGLGGCKVVLTPRV